jgi:hypothetical protein
MSIHAVPNIFRLLLSDGCIAMTDLLNTQDGFWMVYKSLSEILAEKDILDFPDSDGERLACDKFFQMITFHLVYCILFCYY